MDLNEITEAIAKITPLTRRNEPIARHTTVQVGGSASMIAWPADTVELIRCVQALENQTHPVEWTVLGGGANLFADSEGYEGIILNLSNWREEPVIDETGLMVVPGGMDMRQAAEFAARAGWGGIDFMAVVPGSVGGAVCINAGTHYEGYVADRLVWADTVDKSGLETRYKKDELEFGYRRSRLMAAAQIVIRAAFQLARLEGEDTSALLARFDAAMAERERKFPLDQPNFGSTFRSPGAPHPPAGKLLDDLGMKGRRIGNAQISPKHANFIVNLGGATSEDIIALMREMRDAVREAHGIHLRPEVHYLCNRTRQRPDLFRNKIE
ncbi:MAG: UDP-N-acetylmuramate dehydrogenase [Candidatus Sumerlaeia bacterium]